MNRLRAYPIQISILLLFVISLAGCTAANESFAPADIPVNTELTSEVQQPETFLLSQLLAEPTKAISNPNKINLENLDDLTFLTRFGEPGQNLVWSPDNGLFAIVSRDVISLYDSKSFVLINEIQISYFWENGIIPEGLYFKTNSVTFSPNGKVLAFSAYKRESDIVLMDVSTTEVLNVVSLSAENVSSFSFSADGKKIIGVTKNYNQNGKSAWNALFYDIASQETTFLSEDAIEADYFRFSPDGTLFIAGNSSSPLTLYETETSEKIAVLESVDTISFIHFSSDNQYITVGYQNNTIIIWDITGIQMAVLNTDTLWPYVSSIAFSPSGDLMAVADKNGDIDIFVENTGEQIKTLETEFINSTLSFIPDGSILSAETELNGVSFWTTDQDILAAVAANRHPDDEIKENYASLPPGGYILYTDGKGMSVISEDGTFQQGMSSSLQGIPISADGRILSMLSPTFSNDYSGYINLRTGETRKPEYLGAVSPDLKWIAEADICDHSINQLGIEGISTRANTSFCTYVNELKWVETDKVQEGISRIKWSPDAGRLAFVKVSWAKPDYVNQDWSLLLSNALFTTDTTCFRDPRTCDQKTSLAVFNPFKVPCNSIYELSLNWSPDGTYVVLNNGEMFVVFDLRNEYAWKVEKVPANLDNNAQLFGISPDNKWIAYSGDGTNIVLQPFHGGESIELANGMDNVQVLGWILAPMLEVNQTFKVLPDGDHTRIRQKPDFEFDQIGTLYKGNTFTVLDGPVMDDGYTWWYIHSNVDGVEGWVTEFYGRYEEIK